MLLTKTKLFRYTLILCCLLSTGVFAQKAKMTPLQYNDKLASITDSLYNLGIEWGTEFQQIANGNKDYSKLMPQRKKLLAFTLRKINEVRNGPTYGKDAGELKNAMLNFLNFEKEMVDKAFTPMEKLNADTPQSEMDKAISNLTALAEKEADALKNVNAAQEAFGKKNGFTLESAEKEE